MDIVIGGIFPMIFFGLMDFFFRYFSIKIPFQNVFLYTCLGGFLGMTILSSFLFGVNHENLIMLLSRDTIQIGILLGAIWSIAILSMGFAYEKLNANSSQIIPIASASGLLTSILSITFLQEAGNIQILLLSAFIIFMGVLFLQKAEIHEKRKIIHTNILPIIIGGIIPLISFGILNTLFKAYTHLNSGILGIIMTLTGIGIALFIHVIRHQRIHFEPKFLLIGFFWAIAVASLGYGFYPLGGQASVLLPITGASPLISIFLVSIFLDEKVNWKYIIIGSLFIFTGILSLHGF